MFKGLGSLGVVWKLDCWSQISRDYYRSIGLVQEYDRILTVFWKNMSYFLERTMEDAISGRARNLTQRIKYPFSLIQLLRTDLRNI